VLRTVALVPRHLLATYWCPSRSRRVLPQLGRCGSPVAVLVLIELRC
jgi:hypothetical protein